MSARLGIFAVIVLLAIDQISKTLIEAYAPLQEMVPVIPLLAIYRTYNQGIAFSMFTGLGDTALIALTLAIMVFVIWLWRQAHPSRLWARAGFALVMGGALGNLIDRIVHGHVIDFILFHTANWSFAIFNFADSFITVGAALIVFDELIEWRRGRGEAAEGSDNNQPTMGGKD